MSAAHLPRFDLVVATVDRTAPLDALLGALGAQSHRDFRVLIVDQNDDDRVARTLALHPTLSVLHLRSDRGLSRARNAALVHVDAPIVAFPDDDCVYPAELLTLVATRFNGDPGLDGLCGRAASADGSASGRWPANVARIAPDTVWHTAISHTIFLRRELVLQVGRFDEALGLGSGTPWSSGEEIDYLVRALRTGAHIEYDPSLVVTHPVKQLSSTALVALGRRDGASVGYILAANAYPGRAIARMLVRPVLGAIASLALLHKTRARYHVATLAGRVRGLSAGRGRQLNP